jgi:hypothetical protein
MSIKFTCDSICNWRVIWNESTLISFMNVSQGNLYLPPTHFNLLGSRSLSSSTSHLLKTLPSAAHLDFTQPIHHGATQHHCVPHEPVWSAAMPMVLGPRSQGSHPHSQSMCPLWGYWSFSLI